MTLADNISLAGEAFIDIEIELLETALYHYFDNCA